MLVSMTERVLDSFLKITQVFNLSSPLLRTLLPDFRASLGKDGSTRTGAPGSCISFTGRHLNHVGKRIRW
jgi:hypothetical protein